ncbi:MAG: amidohydrolase family protein [Lentisphaerae bacterium]|jgi:predicted TIM-barrel fold metal-dependent hydrolase|nr:amidohydrolase family protein [Lentisphaerota bacterium]
MIRKNSPLAKEFWEKGFVESCPVYDMHGHMGTHYAIYFAAPNAPEMVKLIKRANVKKLCFSHHFSLWATNYVGQDPALEACKQFPDYLRFYCGINPNFPEQMMADLKKVAEWMPYCIGLKFLADYHKVPVNAEPYRPALEFANALHLPILFHTWSMSPYDGPDIMKDIIPKYPNITYILGHCFNSQWQVAGEIAKQYDNVYLELTSVPGTRGALETMVNICGSEKILFGTDMPWFDEHQGIGGLLSAQISDDDVHNILHRNAEKILAPFI